MTKAAVHLFTSNKLVTEEDNYIMKIFDSDVKDAKPI